MKFGVLFEKVIDKDFPSGYYHARVASAGLTSRGLGVEGAREAAADLLRVRMAEKQAPGEMVPHSGETLFTTLELPDDVSQSA